MERSAFLARVRSRLGEPTPTGPDRPSVLPGTMISGEGRGFERFADELSALGGEARRVAPDGVSSAVAAFATGCAGAVVGSDLGPLSDAVLRGLEASGCPVLEPGRAGAASADLGVTAAAYGMASTGSVLLEPRSGSRREGLLPERHLVVLPEDRLLGGLEELLERIPDLLERSSQAVVVTGPSRTSDIEMTSVPGVHGPGRVMVLVVTS